MCLPYKSKLNLVNRLRNFKDVTSLEAQARVVSGLYGNARKCHGKERAEREGKANDTVQHRPVM